MSGGGGSGGCPSPPSSPPSSKKTKNGHGRSRAQYPTSSSVHVPPRQPPQVTRRDLHPLVRPFMKPVGQKGSDDDLVKRIGQVVTNECVCA